MGISTTETYVNVASSALGYVFIQLLNIINLFGSIKFGVL
jgi:hypothetical protein